MNSSPWSPYTPSYLSGDSPQLPHPVSHEERLNNFGGNSSVQLTPYQAVPTRTNNNIKKNKLGPTPSFEPLISPKDTADYIFNSCKENKAGLCGLAQMQSSLSRNEGNSFPSSENNGYTGQVPSISYHSSNMDQPPHGLFGVLPHEAVMPRKNRFERNGENFITPITKATAASYNNGPYADHDTTYNSAPLSVQSAYSGDTASLSPVVNSVSSSNFSSPSEYYNSPKTNFGAYNSLQSPMPQSPSMAQHSYPSSPFTNMDAVNHISVPPCSPMNGGNYVNNMNGVPARNSQTNHHSPSTSAANNVLCYTTPQVQNMTHHGPSQSGLSKVSDYNAEYIYAHEQNSSSSYSSVYPTMHSGQMPNGNNSRLSPRAHSLMNSVAHEGRIHYGLNGAVPSSTISSPNYMPSKVNHENLYGSCSSNISGGQVMHPPKYLPCSSSMNSHRNLHSAPSSMMSNHMSNDKQYVFPSSDLVDDKGALDLFNSHVDSGAHEPELTSSISNFLENDLHMLESETVTGRQLRPRMNEYNSNKSATLRNTDNSIVQTPSALNEHVNGGLLTAGTKYPYSSSLDQSRPENYMNNLPKKRGRRGRKRKADVNGRNTWRRGPLPKKDHTIFNNGASLPAKNIHEVSGTSYYKNSSRNLDERALTPKSDDYSRPKVSVKQSIGENAIGFASDVFHDNGKKNEPYNTQEHIRGPYNTHEVLKEMMDLIQKSVITRRRTRNTDRRESPFQACFKDFVSQRKVSPDDQWPPPRLLPKQEKTLEQHKSKKSRGADTNSHKIKLTLVRQTREWYCINDIIPSQSDDDGSKERNVISLSDDTLSGQSFNNDVNSGEEKSNHSILINSSSKVTEKPSANRKVKSNDLEESHLNYSNNYQTLPAGKVKAEKSSESYNSDEQVNMPKKSGRKAKLTPETNTNTSIKTTDAYDAISKTIKKEKIDEAASTSERWRTLRSRKRENSLPKEPESGSTVKDEPPDYGSDLENFDIDDTDSDPAWTPSTKAVDPAKSFTGQLPSRKRHSKNRGRKSACKNNATKRKRGRSPNSNTKKKCAGKTEALPDVKKTPNSAKMKKDENDRFLVAKADINLPTPYIWKVDKKSSMLQRFEISEQNGVLLYHSSFTFAARNEISINNYVTAEVRIKSPDTVQYLGPNLSEVAALSLSKIKASVALPKESPKKKEEKENFDHLKDDFTVYIQSLLSQDVDSSFFDEIKKFNDEYFLVPISNLEAVSESKKNKLTIDSWNEKLKKCLNTYPCMSIVNSFKEKANCQFSFIHYKNRLHIQIKTLFNKCRSKANEVKGSNNLMSHEDVLKSCLEDIAWIEKMFGEQTQIWHEVEEKS
ncbi:hypothetical protein HNY73_022828 [Argiope bruennichi]|uniref:DUF4211 domain-containing protein n=1 Tax=Argiope bruennichi TaxID=94029 RepID=A0A8T0E257_ARGBR|nr:hypothetical protein HNY73_022828 [Argiope bruennichi]